MLRSAESPRGQPLHRSDSSPHGDAPVDLPLREETPDTWETAPSAQRYLFESAPAPLGVEVDGPSPARIGISLWMVAAASLVIGIVIGFASGFSAGRRADGIASLWPAAAPVAEPSSEASPTAGGSDQPFTEGTVSEPVRVDPEPIVPPAPAPAPTPAPARAPVPAPAPVTEAPAASPPRSPRTVGSEESVPAASGPGSLHVVSRPAGAEVYVDGRIVGKTPLLLSNVGNGAHDVRLQLSGFRRWATTVQIRAGARTRVAASLEQ